jgi:hypothetical protein
MKKLAKQLVLIAKGILKLDDSQTQTLGGWITTYIGVRVEDVSLRLAHEAKAGEVVCLAFGLLILLWARGVVPGEVKVAEGSTCSGHYLLEVLLVPEAVLLLVVALTVVIPFGVVVHVGGGVELLPLGAFGDEVGGVAALEAAPRWSPLLVEPMQGAKLSRQQGDPVVGDSLILLIRSCSQRGSGKLQSRWVSSVGGVSNTDSNMSTSNKRLTSKRSIMVRTTFPR